LFVRTCMLLLAIFHHLSGSLESRPISRTNIPVSSCFLLWRRWRTLVGLIILMFSHFVRHSDPGWISDSYLGANFTFHNIELSKPISIASGTLHELPVKNVRWPCHRPLPCANTFNQHITSGRPLPSAQSPNIGRPTVPLPLPAPQTPSSKTSSLRVPSSKPQSFNWRQEPNTCSNIQGPSHVQIFSSISATLEYTLKI
jgi:hypothetical protein